ncbi:MAG: hypothetical protein ACK40U_08895, partial [Fervidobacterium pennivorans]
MKVLDFKRWFGLFVKKTSNHFQQLATHSFYLLFLLVVFIIILLSSCTSNQSTSNVPKFSIVYPEKTFANTNVTISVQPLEPGLTNIRIKLKNADSQVYEE